MEYQNIYVDGAKKFSIKKQAVPTTSQILELDLFACRVCLATDIKLFDIHECDLAESFQTVMGLPIPPNDGLPQHLCHYCFSQLQKYAIFREKCKHSLDILETAVLLSQPLTTEYIRIIDRTAEGLALPLSIHDNIIDYEIITEMEPEETISMQDIDNVKEEIVYEEQGENVEESVTYDVVEQDYTPEEEILSNVKVEIKSAPKPPKPKSERAKYQRASEHAMIEVATLSRAQQEEEMRNRKHSPAYLSALHKCDKCYKGFHNGVAFRNHMVLHNPASGPIECEVCEMRFVSEAKLKIHAANVHERRYLCRQCGHVSCSSHRALEHQKFHEGKLYECQFCRLTFDKSWALMSHLRSTHQEEYDQRTLSTMRPGTKRQRPNTETWITCVECASDFNGATAFSRHMNTASRHTEDGGGYFYYCTFCGESFDGEAPLQDHKITHVGCEEVHPKKGWRRDDDEFVEKPYTCHYCGKAFKVQQYLQIHVRTHTGERPYVCNICAMAFQAKANLNRHYKVHTGDKPYMCDLCGRSFTQSNSMKLHVKTVHLKMPDPYKDRRKFYRVRAEPRRKDPEEDDQDE